MIYITGMFVVLMEVIAANILAIWNSAILAFVYKKNSIKLILIACMGLLLMMVFVKIMPIMLDVALMGVCFG